MRQGSESFYGPTGNDQGPAAREDRAELLSVDIGAAAGENICERYKEGGPGVT